MANSISFATGAVNYDINGKIEVQLNPTDMSFAERLFSTFEELDAEQDRYREKLTGEVSDAEIFKMARELNGNIRAKIDTLFGAEVCTAVFGDMNVYAMADGLPVWVNLLLAIIEVMDDSVKRERAATSPRLEKYIKKYGKR